MRIGTTSIRRASRHRVSLSTRLPEHAQLREVQATVDDQPVDVRWAGRHARFGRLAPGQVVRLAYPLCDRHRDYDIGGKAYTGWWRGATLLEMEPPGEGYPIYRRRHLIEGQAAGVCGRPVTDVLPPPNRPLWG